MNEELKATDALLDIGVSVPLRPIRFRRWKRVHRVTMRRPPLGGLLRVLKVYLALDTDVKTLSKMSDEQALKFMAENGKAVSKIVALSVWSGFLTGRFAPLLAWWLRWRCHPNVLFYAMTTFIGLQDAENFTNIIRLVDGINVLKPNLSQKAEKRS